MERRLKIPGVMHVGIMPIPPMPENTEYVKAGPVTIGVEYRYLTLDMVMAEFKKQNRPPEEIPDPATIATEEGVSIHVMGDVGGDLKEYVRFDCLSSGPHYHYIGHKRDFPDYGDHSVVAGIDPISIGEPIPWALDRLRHRLPEMLAFAGRKDLAEKVKGNAEYEAALPEVAQAAKRASVRSEEAAKAYGGMKGSAAASSG